MLIVGNWKAYVEDPKVARAIGKQAERLLASGHTLVLAPSAPLVGYLRAHTTAAVAIGIQDCSEVSGGAATGEVTARAAKAAGATYVILGHSERRARGESDDLVARKTAAALDAGLTPVVCIGEQVRDAEAAYLPALAAQLASAFQGATPDQRSRIVIAYEPVWAIGKPPTEAMQPDDLEEMVRYLRKQLTDLVGSEHAASAPILYGGAVDATNARQLLTGTGATGLLVGRASADPKAFAALVRALG